MSNEQIDREIRKQNDRMIEGAMWFLGLTIFGNVVLLILLNLLM
jgi:hypothetical protein